MKLLKEGSSYVFSNLLVSLNDPKFKSTNNKYKLHFIDNTHCTLVEANEISKYHFDFMSFSNILSKT